MTTATDTLDKVQGKFEKVTHKMREEIEKQGHKLEEIDLVELKDNFTDKAKGAYCEGLFKTKTGEQFLCGEMNGEVKYTPMTRDEATAWAENRAAHSGFGW